MDSLTRLAASAGRQIQSLDGEWDIVFDPENEGRRAGLHRAAGFAGAQARKITVPCCWERLEKDYEGVAFYRHVFRVPTDWEGKAIRLQFDAVNFRAEVWLNDSAVGFHEGGFTPFEFPVDDVLDFGGENTLILRVLGPILMQDKVIDGVGRLETPQWRGAITGGIWQSVRLVATGDIRLEDVFVEPLVSEGVAAFRLTVSNRGAQDRTGEIAVALAPAGDPGASAVRAAWNGTLRPGTNRQDIRLAIPDMVCWSPENPFLYRADIRVTTEDGVSDVRSERFGMREFTIRDNRFCLNGHPVYLKATFFEGLYPIGLAYPDSREMAIREISLAKEAGFNMIRPWRKPPPPMWLDLCDELGVLTVGSLAVECMDFPVESARLPGWVENEVRQSILRDRSRTCVVQWELFNELKRPVLKRLLRPMSMLARELDPTRLILDESGGWAHGANMYLPYDPEPTRFNDIHDYPGPHINDEVFTKLLLAGSMTHEEMRAMGLTGRLPGDNVVPGLMTFFSELGYGSLPDLPDNNRRFAEVGNPLLPPTDYHRRLADEHRHVLRESGFDRIFPDLGPFCLDQQRHHGTANRRMIEAVRCNPHVAGYCIHALTDGNWIIGAGLLDLFRNPKGDVYEETKAAGLPRILCIRARPRNVYAERGTTITITGVNEGEAVSGELAVTITGPDGETVLADAAEVRLESGISELFSRSPDTRARCGTYRVHARLTAEGGAAIAANALDFEVFPTDSEPGLPKRIGVLDPANSLAPFLQACGLTGEAFRPGADPAVPVFVARTEARTPEERALFEALCEHIHAGGTGVYLGGGGPGVVWGRAVKTPPLLPVAARQKIAVATWNGVSHLVKDHPLFAGLPVDCSMGSVYENLRGGNVLLDVPGETVAGAIGYDWFPDYDPYRRHYVGPGATWWGASVVVAPAGKGRCILSQLRLVGNLGKDPAADRILRNMIRFASPA